MINRVLRYGVLSLFVATAFRGVASEESSPRRVMLDKVVAVVGSSAVLMSEVEMTANAMIEQQRREGYTSERDPRSEAFEALLTQRLLASQAKLDSVDVNLLSISTSVEMQVSAMRDRAGGVKELEREFNMEIFNIRDILRRRSEEQAYAQAMQEDVMSGVRIVPGEVERYYKSHDRDSLPMIGEQYRYAQITRFPRSIDDAKRRVSEQLLDMREKVITGKTRFTSLAQMYSVDPGSAYRGGEMEPQPSSAFVPAFAEALESLKVGQVSEVVETEFGFHIIEMIDKKGDLYHCRHILLRPSYSTAELMEPINFLDSLAGQIRCDSITFEKAALLHSDDSASKMNGGIVTNHDMLDRYNIFDPKLTATRFLKEDFGARGYKSLDDFLALSKLKEGEVSAAFTTEDLVGNQLSKIVKLVEIYPAHTASIEEDYLQLEAMALAAKQETIFKAWLDKIIASTYVYISPEFRDMEFENPRWVKK